MDNSLLYKDEKAEKRPGGHARSCSRLVAVWLPSPAQWQLWEMMAAKAETHEHLGANSGCEPKAISQGGVRLADKGGCRGQ